VYVRNAAFARHASAEPQRQGVLSGAGSSPSATGVEQWVARYEQPQTTGWSRFARDVAVDQAGNVYVLANIADWSVIVKYTQPGS